MTYNSPEFAAAEARYRRERLTRDWHTRRLDTTANGSAGDPAHAAASAAWRLTPQRQRHAA